MGSFSQLWLGIAQIEDDFSEELGFDVILDVFWVQIDYFQH